MRIVPAAVSGQSGRMPLQCAEYWDAKAARTAHTAQNMKNGAARAAMLSIAAQYEVLAERVRRAERALAEMDC